MLPENAKFCLECGEEAVPAAPEGMVVCPECGKTVVKGKFCPECGHKFVSSCPKCGKEIVLGGLCMLISAFPFWAGIILCTAVLAFKLVVLLEDRNKK